MRRREFITLLGGAAATWPLAARAQQAGKMPTIGYLGASTPSAQGDWLTALVQRLREHGWTEGRNVTIEVRWAQNRPDRYAEIAAEFVRLKVDVIVTLGIAVPAAKRATSSIPIVFAVDADPVGSGLVASLARPGGNVTGLSSQSPDTASKRLQLLREVLPDLRRIATLGNADWHGAVEELKQVQTVGPTLGLDVVDKLEIRRADEIEAAFASLKGGPQALYVSSDPLVAANRIRIITLALAARLPTSFVRREYIEAGGLMSYGPSFLDLNRRAADFVDKILRGAKPADLPVEQPTKFDLILNLTTAKALGLRIPEAFLLRADEVIE
jgi:putative tryptophan/tyrosine transport system substrate-binding protein